MATVSVCILACDEETELRCCLESVSWVDEIVVVVDAKSRDGSEKIARDLAHRVEVRPYRGDLEQKRYCSSLAGCDWVLVLDPDEEVSPELARELRGALAEDGRVDGRSYAGFEVNRLTHHLGRWVRHGDFYPDWKLRLFRRSQARWVGLNPHGRVEVQGPVKRLRGDLRHHGFRDLSDHIGRIQLHSGQAARALAASGRRARLRDLLLRPPARFLRGYFLKRGLLDGMAGFVIAVVVACSVFLKYAKLWELERGTSRDRADQGPQTGV
jgi:glycosyltransferase involved in cell wall biosynthesis